MERLLPTVIGPRTLTLLPLWNGRQQHRPAIRRPSLPLLDRLVDLIVLNQQR